MVLDLRHRLDEIVVAGKRLGRAVEFDAASAAFRIQEADAAVIRDVKWTRRAPIFNQGHIGSCTGNAGAGAKGTDSAGRTGDRKMREKAAAALYSLATELDGFPGTYPPDDTGSSTLGVLKAMKRDGWIRAYLHAFSLAAVQTGLQQGAMITGTSWYDSFDSPASDGLVTISKGAQVRGGHEYDIVGLDLEGRRLECVNSWGPGWGVRGHFFIGFDDYDRLLHEHGDAGQPVWA